ncbi:MAG: hypothetical protein AB8G18_18190 [Gammaproteobacteria bacterium]
MKSFAKILFVSAIAAGFFGPLSVVSAAVPDGINYQAYLTNTDGSPVDADVSISFLAYNVATGGVPLWNDTQTITVDQGLFSITLGNPANPFPVGLFDTPVYIGMFVAGEELLPRRELTTAAYSFKSADSELLNGVSASALDQSGDVTALQGDVSANDSRISNLESVGADITGVSIGGGLVGGGDMGNVVLAVAPGGIDVTHIAPNSINSAAIIDGAVSPTKLNPTGVYTMGGANVNGTSNLNGSVNIGGALEIDSFFDLRILDDVHGFRWFNGDGDTEHAAFVVSANTVSFQDSVRGRNLVISNSNGVGINVTNPEAGYGVTVPSLSVQGASKLGLERVSVVYELSSMAAQCHSHGNLPCYYGSTTVQCPTGKQVLGGGSTGPTPRYGSIAISHPSGTTAWSCGTSYDLENNSRTCFALCANIE